MLTKKGLKFILLMLIMSYIALALTLNILTSLPPLLATLIVLFFLSSWNPEVTISRDVVVDEKNRVITMKLKVSSEPYTVIELCDDIPPGVIVFENSNCISKVTDGKGEFYHSYKVKAFIHRLLWKDLYVTVHHPMGLATKRRRIEVPYIITLSTLDTHAKELLVSKEMSHRELTPIYVEPFVDRVRPYIAGDDFKLIIPKSILMPGGPRVKVLSSKEIQVFEKMNIAILVIPGKWCCASEIIPIAIESLVHRILSSLVELRPTVRLVIASHDGMDTNWIELNTLMTSYIHDLRSKLCSEVNLDLINNIARERSCLLYTSPSPRDLSTSRMPSSA